MKNMTTVAMSEPDFPDEVLGDDLYDLRVIAHPPAPPPSLLLAAADL